jgi:hypothetical protein
MPLSEAITLLTLSMTSVSSARFMADRSLDGAVPIQDGSAAMRFPWQASRSHLYPSTRRLDNAIIQLTHTALSPERLQGHLEQALSEPGAIPLEGCALISEIADELGATCALIFQQAICSLQEQPIQLETEQPDHTDLTPLNSQIKRLCLLWALGKQQQPTDGFFKAQWQHPALQAILKRSTTQFRQSSPYSEWIDRYPTCWAYTFGSVMHQLLQWNHQLDPIAVRAPWPIETIQ